MHHHHARPHFIEHMQLLVAVLPSFAPLQHLFSWKVAKHSWHAQDMHTVLTKHCQQPEH